jgi:hypothetical protein
MYTHLVVSSSSVSLIAPTALPLMASGKSSRLIKLLLLLLLTPSAVFRSSILLLPYEETLQSTVALPLLLLLLRLLRDDVRDRLEGDAKLLIEVRWWEQHFNMVLLLLLQLYAPWPAAPWAKGRALHCANCIVSLLISCAVRADDALL